MRRGDDRLARVFVHGERARVEFDAFSETARSVAADHGLRIDSDRSPQPLVFVEDGAQVKRAVDVFEAASRAVSTDDASGANSD